MLTEVSGTSVLPPTRTNDVERTRVMVVTPIPTPYRDPFWAEVSKRPELDLDIVYCSAGKSDRPWELNWGLSFQTHFPPAYNLAKWCGVGASCYWNPDIMKLLRSKQYDVIITGGYNHVSMLAAIAYARRHGIPYAMQCEVYLRQPRSRWRTVVKAPLVRSLVKRARGCLPTGTLASEYLVHYGARPENLRCVPNVPDLDGLDLQSRELHPRRDELKRARGLDDRPVILFVSRLISLKRVDILLESMREILKEQNATLVILGDGPMKATWEALARSLGIADHVRFEGFLAPADLPEWYAVADLFVLPSEDETWSVVVLEALAAGVPVVITELVGCCADVVNDPRVGSVVPPADAPAMTAAMKRHLHAKTSWEEIKAAWEPVRRRMTYSAVADQFVAAMQEWKKPACSTTSPHVATIHPGLPR